MHTKVSEIRDFVLREREKALSEREWKFRLRGYGYDVRVTERGLVITSLVRGSDVCAIIV